MKTPWQAVLDDRRFVCEGAAAVEAAIRNARVKRVTCPTT